MISHELKRMMAPRARVLNMIWGAFLAAPALYLVIARFLTADPAQEAAGAGVDRGLIIGIFAVAAVGLAAASFVYPRTAFTPERLARALPDDAAVPASAQLAAEERRLAGLWPYYQTTLIVIWALRESIAVLGLVLTILTGHFVIVLPFAMAAFGLIFLGRPRPYEFLGQGPGGTGR